MASAAAAAAVAKSEEERPVRRTRSAIALCNRMIDLHSVVWHLDKQVTFSHPYTPHCPSHQVAKLTV